MLGGNPKSMEPNVRAAHSGPRWQNRTGEGLRPHSWPQEKDLRPQMSDILERVRKIVIEHLDADPEKVTEKASFIDDLGADSLDNVELVMAFEEEFDIEIPDDAAEHIQTVGDAVKFIGERLGA
jgi:acyl carrier protein